MVKNNIKEYYKSEILRMFEDQKIIHYAFSIDDSEAFAVLTFNGGVKFMINMYEEEDGTVPIIFSIYNTKTNELLYQDNEDDHDSFKNHINEFFTKLNNEDIDIDSASDVEIIQLKENNFIKNDNFIKKILRRITHKKS